MKHTLSLRTERLAELTTDDLHRVHGAAVEQTGRTVIDCIVIGEIKTLHGCTTNTICP